MTDLKKKLETQLVAAYCWVQTRDMTADVLTKEGSNIENILEVIRENVFRKAQFQRHVVVFKEGEMMVLSQGQERFDQDDNLNQTRAGGEY